MLLVYSRNMRYILIEYYLFIIQIPYFLLYFYLFIHQFQIIRALVKDNYEVVFVNIITIDNITLLYLYEVLTGWLLYHGNFKKLFCKWRHDIPNHKLYLLEFGLPAINTNVSYFTYYHFFINYGKFILFDEEIPSRKG